MPATGAPRSPRRLETAARSRPRDAPVHRLQWRSGGTSWDLANTAAMLEGMLRPAGFVLVIWSAAAVAGPHEPNANRTSGRVVRVVRTSGASHASPRLCEIRGDGGTCVGDEPRRGDTVVVLDDRHAIAEVQIVEAKLSAAACPMVWVVKTRALRGAADGEGIGVIDAGL